MSRASRLLLLLFFVAMVSIIFLFPVSLIDTDPDGGGFEPGSFFPGPGKLAQIPLLQEDMTLITIPPGMESDSPLPEKVSESYKSSISITTGFTLPNPFGQPSTFKTYGTGFMIEPGIFVSARHIFMEEIQEYSDRVGYPYEINDKGLPESKLYKFNFYGNAVVGEKFKVFPMELIGMGDVNTILDVAVFRSTHHPSLRPLESEDELVLDEDVYCSGRVPVALRNLRKMVPMDVINYTFQGKVSKIIVGTRINKESGLDKFYRFRMPIKEGFSGGPCFNKDGRVIGHTMASVGYFMYAISVADTKRVIKDLRQRGVLPKNKNSW